MGGYGGFADGESLGIPQDVQQQARLWQPRRSIFDALMRAQDIDPGFSRPGPQRDPDPGMSPGRIEDDPSQRPHSGMISAPQYGPQPTRMTELEDEYQRLGQPVPGRQLPIKNPILRGIASAALGMIAPRAAQQQIQNRQTQQAQNLSLREKILPEIEAERRLQEQEDLATKRMTLQEQMQSEREKAAQESQERLFGQQNQLEDTREKARQADQQAQQQASEDRQNKAIQAAADRQQASERAAADRQNRQFAESEKMLTLHAQNQKVTADEQRRADLAENMNENLDQLEDIVKRRPELFGGPLGIKGRYTQLKGALGSGDPDVAKLNAIREFFGMASVSAHTMRNAQHVGAAADSVLAGFKNSPEATLAAMQVARASARTFQEDIDRVRGGGGGSQTPRGNLNSKVQNQAPEGTRIQVGDQVQVKRNGKWVPEQK
jgi:hypothetical protein